ncbi:hypothetical protein TNCV_1853751 [Trichonephila clavipes]|nr:hypothetical protein TNCV_1853751 [Trichonephila clavipes]
MRLVDWARTCEERPLNASKIWVEQRQIVLPPVWCSKLRITPGVHLALCHEEFREPRSDAVRQMALTATTTS